MVRQIQCQLGFTGSTDKPTWKKDLLGLLLLIFDLRFKNYRPTSFKKWRKVNLQVRTGLWKTKNSRL